MNLQFIQNKHCRDGASNLLHFCLIFGQETNGVPAWFEANCLSYHLGIGQNQVCNISQWRERTLAAVPGITTRAS